MYIFIVNPVAGKGKAMSVYKKIQKHPLFKEKDCRTFFTRYEGHGTELTRQLVQIYHEKIKSIIVVGGDGTVHEVINGLKSDSSIHLSYIPAGSGNDFARGIYVNTRAKKLFEQIVTRPNWKPYWFGRYSMKNWKAHYFRYFASNIGFGFDAEVAEHANGSRFKTIANRFRLGTLGYVFSLISVLFRYKPKQIELSVDGEKKIFEEAWMVTVASHPFFGGGMKIAPGAKNNPNDFHIIVVDRISRWKILALFVTVFFGKHTALNEVHVMKAKNIEVKVKEGIYYHADGQTGKCHHCHITKEVKKYFVHQGKVGS
ncbi:MAG: diacylglycerol kinase family lipid kinase [Bacillaceae bacterium]|nr:diacylglycerol kinase family lipid kinase [Bacillaceae bacterium]